MHGERNAYRRPSLSSDVMGRGASPVSSLVAGLTGASVCTGGSAGACVVAGTSGSAGAGAAEAVGAGAQSSELELLPSSDDRRHIDAESESSEDEALLSLMAELLLLLLESLLESLLRTSRLLPWIATAAARHTTTRARILWESISWQERSVRGEKKLEEPRRYLWGFERLLSLCCRMI